MAVKRTKKHKLKQAEKQVATYSLSDLDVKLSSSKPGVQKQTKPTKTNSPEMFGYSIEFIRQDLLKTFIVTLIVVSVLIGIVYFELQ